MELRHIEAAEFEQVISSGNKILVDFFATWCGPCKMIAPMLEDLAEELAEGQEIVKFDIDKGIDIAGKYMVTAVPTLVMFKDGKECGRMVGVRDEQDILDMFNA